MPGIDVGDIGGFIREQRDSAQMSIRQLAQASGVSNPYLSQIERGLRRPSAQMLARIAEALRISAETLYVQAGILTEPTGDMSVATAIARDTSLTEGQRRTLLDIYAAFQAETRLSSQADTTKEGTSA
jgi:transcriptional regulator with XRE-family HTH domain